MKQLNLEKTAFMKKNSTFTKGSGCYVCVSCGLKTRDDGNGDSVNCKLCTRCYELSGIENLISDGDYTPNDLESAMILMEQIKARGGKVSFEHMDKVEAHMKKLNPQSFSVTTDPAAGVALVCNNGAVAKKAAPKVKLPDELAPTIVKLIENATAEPKQAVKANGLQYTTQAALAETVKKAKKEMDKEVKDGLKTSYPNPYLVAIDKKGRLEGFDEPAFFSELPAKKYILEYAEDVKKQCPNRAFEIWACWPQACGTLQDRLAGDQDESTGDVVEVLVYSCSPDLEKPLNANAATEKPVLSFDQIKAKKLEKVKKLLPAGWEASLGCDLNMFTLAMSPEHISVYRTKPAGRKFDAEWKTETTAQGYEIIAKLRAAGMKATGGYEVRVQITKSK